MPIIFNVKIAICRISTTTTRTIISPAVAVCVCLPFPVQGLRACVGVGGDVFELHN